MGPTWRCRWDSAIPISEGVGHALFQVTIGQTYFYVPTDLSGNYLLQIIGTNLSDSNALAVDPSGQNFFRYASFTTNQDFIATQNTVTFVNASATTGAMNDQLYQLGQGSNLVLSNAVASGMFTGTLAGNAQGGAVTNLDAAIVNLRDLAYNFPAAFANWTNLGGVIYVPGEFSSAQSFQFNNTSASAGTIGISSSPLTMTGNGPALSEIYYNGNNQTMFDSSACYSPIGINFNGLYALSQWGGNNNFYVSGIWGDGLIYWDNVELRQWNVGASVSQAGSEFDALRLDWNNLGLQMQFISDESIINVLQSYNNADAGLELDSRGTTVHDNTYSDQIGILIGEGGNDFIQTVSEFDTNCVIAFGYPPWWPTNLVPAKANSFAWPGNDVVVQGGSFGWGYMYASGPTNANSGLSSYMKIWNAPGSKVDIHSFSYTATLNGGPFVASYVPAADSFTPFTFDGVLTAPTPLMQFSDGTTIPAADGYHVGVNDPDLEYTKNALVYSRDTNGDLFAAGNITARGILSATTAQLGALTLTNAAGGNLLGADAHGNVTGISLGSGLTLSGGTLSASLLGGGGSPLGTVINTYFANHTATAQDGTILVSGPNLIITLPDASLIGAGRSYLIKLISSSHATVATTGGQTIDGSIFYSLTSQYKYVTVQSDGSQWWIVGNN